MMYNLERFVRAQDWNYDDALREIRNGKKRSCWMWYVFPQLRELGRSSTAKLYGLSGLAEAKAYLAHPVLRAHLLEICEAALETESSDASDVFGSPDDMKLCSSMTLFELAEPENPVFGRVLEKFFHGRRDALTLRIVKCEEK